MPAREAKRLQRGSRYRHDPVLRAAVVIAVGLGLTVASGSVFGGSGTTASVGEAVVPALIGGLVGACVGAAAVGAIRFWMAPQWPIVRPFAVTTIVVAVGLGALAGASTAPTERFTEVLPTTGGAVTAIPTGSVAAGGVVVPVDGDADGEPDTFDGEPILGFDIDDDDVVDGILQRCSRELDPLVEERTGYLAIDLACDSTVDEYLPFDEDRILSEVLPSALPPEQDDDGTYATTLITVGLIVMLLALLVALGFFLSQMAHLERPLDRELVRLSTALTEPEEPIDIDKVADVLHASLDGVLLGTDPRVAIRIAYGILLDGLSHIGLTRRPEEAPDEHMERCLQAADLPADPIRELLRLFALARFSPHPITEGHRTRAVAALDSAIARVGRLEVVG